VGFWFAFLVFAAGTAGLFWLDRNKFERTSKALWLPVIWLWIIGSRPVSAWTEVWLGFGTQGGADLDKQLDGSPTDALILALLLVAGIVVLNRRKKQTNALLKASLPVVIYFIYCLVSVSWSPFTAIAFKRWIKGLGDLVMVLVILTEADPIAALRRLFSRVGFILLPASVFLIRYSSIGRGFDEYGDPTDTGVTTNKNALGLITFIIAIGAVWNLRMLLRNRLQPNRGRRLLAQGTLVAFGMAVLGMAHSATSVACLILGSGLMMATGLSWVGRRPGRMHAVILAIALAAGVGMVFGADEMAVHALGRKTNLTGRTDIWKTVIPMAQNPIFGTGFESFWNASAGRLHQFTGDQANMFKNLVSAHNGYIDVYLNLGLVGVSLIALILITGYWRAGAAFRRDPEIGGLILAYIVTAAIYSITEAGFKVLTPTWFFVLCAVIAAGGVSRGYLRTQVPAQPRRRSRGDVYPSRWIDPLPAGRVSASGDPDGATQGEDARQGVRGKPHD
jgi:exopolysaccharide production protein ExoQ